MFRKAIFILCLISLCAGLFLVAAQPVWADTADDKAKTKTEAPTTEKTTKSKTTKLRNPLGTTNISAIVGKIIKALLGIVGSLALLMFIYGGFTWLTAAGSPEKVKKGRDILTWASIGIVTIFVAYIGVGFVINALVGIGGGGDSGEDSEEVTEEYCEENPDDTRCLGAFDRPDTPEGEVTCFYERGCICETVPTLECLGLVIRSGSCPPEDSEECGEGGGGDVGMRDRCCCPDGEARGISNSRGCGTENDIRGALGDPTPCTWMRASDCPIRLP